MLLQLHQDFLKRQLLLDKCLKRRLQIQNRLGLHARAAAKFVQTANRFAAEIWVTHKSQRVNGKSIMGIMMLAATFETWLELEVSGEDADEALLAITELMANKFGED
ncbi:MAG: phosphocarrier protein HPr [Legionellales bacterium]|nr:phosphocarrier protein HPr [Legionellales bacterium]